MVYALSWFFVVALLALWSLLVWALHGAAAWAVVHAGGLKGAASGLGAVTLPAWLAPWVPPELQQLLQALAGGFGPLVDGLLQAMPALAGLLGVLAWGLWGLGALLLVLLGVGAHLLVALWRRRGVGGPAGGAAVAAG